MASARVIMPRGPVFKAARIERAIQNTLTNVAKDMKIDFDVTTQTWRNRPASKIETPSQYERKVSVDSDIYTMLDVGTRPHIIRPKKIVVDKRTGKRRRVRLHFMMPFKSKTLPNQIMSRAGQQGSTPVVARVVRHPGTKARHFAKTIAAKWNKQVGPIFQRAIAAEYR